MLTGRYVALPNIGIRVFYAQLAVTRTAATVSDVYARLMKLVVNLVPPPRQKSSSSDHESLLTPRLILELDCLGPHFFQGIGHVESEDCTIIDHGSLGDFRPDGDAHKRSGWVHHRRDRGADPRWQPVRSGPQR